MANGKHLFVTVGTTKFDSLIREFPALKTDTLRELMVQNSEVTSKACLETLAKLGFTDVTLQIGRGDFEPTDASKSSGTPHVSFYRLKDSTADDIKKADLVISHAGAGSIMDSLGAGKSVLVVINEELMGNHQIELADKLAQEEHLHYCGVASLVKKLESLDFSTLKPLPPGQPEKFAEHLDRTLGFL